MQQAQDMLLLLVLVHILKIFISMVKILRRLLCILLRMIISTFRKPKLRVIIMEVL